ncbi:hypothetical protein [Pedobacter deserti]|uniref:hypothetical protein n=1 Tax=Pedobacter deserti TaxID=2817382 RepID=UPI00210A508A|nr:hypothetical protein [Pedobacter sp. SYSU D00382]
MVEEEAYNHLDFGRLIDNPGQAARDDVDGLQAFVSRYPYFRATHLLLAKATSGRSIHNSQLATAALYNGGALVHDIIYNPDQLRNFSFVSEKAQPEQLKTELAETDVIDEVYEEIAEVDIHSFQSAESDDIADSLPEGVSKADPMLENIVTSDFFAFQENFKPEPASAEAQPEAPEIEEYSIEAELEQDTVISKYDDDRLPYTFLWWLAKTRKEHEQIFQPYAAPRQDASGGAKATASAGPLQQQYVEHIFHLQGPMVDDDRPAPAAQRRHKGDEIIENFIKSEPQITPPRPEQINVENKAKKSAEDHNDLVSETLAKIYIEQMLYDKAIDTYQKLSLMFPEKSRYFADLIQSIEKKI